MSPSDASHASSSESRRNPRRRAPLEARPDREPGPALPGTGPYHRVLLKLSGEAFAGKAGYGIDQAVLASFAGQVRDVHAAGCELALVIGGGNIFRGIAGSAAGMDRATGDYMGMLATVMNALALQD